MSVASGSCAPCVRGDHERCWTAGPEWGLWPSCPCARRDHAPADADAPWCDADLAAMERDYARGGHDDTFALIRGVRAVLRLHMDDGHGYCDECSRYVAAAIPAPCPTVRALNHPEETP